MNLERFITALGPTEVVHGAAGLLGGGGGSIEISELAYDTRTTVPGVLFFCVRGRNADGHELAPEAASRGAAALVVEKPVPVELPQLVVPSVRRAMPVAAELFFDSPSTALDVAAVTGTNGKTTTAFLI